MKNWAQITHPVHWPPSSPPRPELLQKNFGRQRPRIFWQNPFLMHKTLLANCQMVSKSRRSVFVSSPSRSALPSRVPPPQHSPGLRFACSTLSGLTPRQVVGTATLEYVLCSIILHNGHQKDISSSFLQCTFTRLGLKTPQCLLISRTSLLSLPPFSPVLVKAPIVLGED